MQLSSLFTLIPLSIIIIYIILLVRSRKKNKITRENSTAMQAVLLCFRRQRWKGGSGRHITSNAKARIDPGIPNLHKYGHLIPTRGGGMYGVRNGRKHRPVVVANINGEDWLLVSRFRNARLTTADLGKQVSILYRGRTFIFNDDESLANAGKTRHILGV